MYGPYREARTTTADAPIERERDPEANIIYALLAFLGTGRLGAAWFLHEPLGAEATVALLFALIGLAGLVAGLFRR